MTRFSSVVAVSFSVESVDSTSFIEVVGSFGGAGAAAAGAGVTIAAGVVTFCGAGAAAVAGEGAAKG